MITRRFWNPRAALIQRLGQRKFNIIACGVDVATGAKIEITHQREVQYQHWRHNVWAQKSQHSCWLSDMCLEQHILNVNGREVR